MLTLFIINVRNVDVYRPAVRYTRYFSTSKSNKPVYRNTTFWLANSKNHSNYCTADTFSDNPDIRCILPNLNIHQCSLQNLPLVPLLSHIHPSLTFLRFSAEINLNIILICTFMSSKCHFSLIFSTVPSVQFSLSRACYVSRQFHIPITQSIFMIINTSLCPWTNAIYQAYKATLIQSTYKQTRQQ